MTQNSKREARHGQFFEKQGSGTDNGFCLKKIRTQNSPIITDPDELTVPETEYIKYSKGDAERYLKSGRRDARLLRQALVDAGVDKNSGPGNFLDFGCANARVLRWFVDWANHGEAWGVDINAEMIFWCHQHLSPPFNFAVSTTTPHLFFEDRFFDAIFCFSIFTHIDDLHLSWLCELRRVVKPGGFLYITIFDEDTAKIQEELEYEAFKRKQASDSYHEFIETNAGFCATGRDWKSLISFKREYFLDIVSRQFDVVQVIEKAMGLSQTGFLLKRKSL